MSVNTAAPHDESRIRRAQAHLRLLAEASTLLLTGDRHPYAILGPLLEAAGEDLGADRIAALDVAPDRKHLRMVFSFGFDETQQDHIREIPFEKTLCGLTAESGERVILADVQASAEPRLEPGRAWNVRAYACFPIFVGGVVATVLSFSSTTEAAFDDATIAFFETIARYIEVVRARRVGEQALQAEEQRYRTLFNSIDEGFCIIEFFDGPHGPLSDYVHVEANPAYTLNAGIPDVVGKRLREMVPDEADGWVEFYGKVLRTGQPIRFERELVATGRHLELAAFRVEPASKRQVAVLFKDVTARRQAERRLKELNETLEQRVSTMLAERKLLADIVAGMEGYVQVIDREFRWLALNDVAVRTIERLYGTRPKIGASVLDVLASRPDHLALMKSFWQRALAGEDFVETTPFENVDGEKRYFEQRFNILRDPHGAQIGAYQFAYDVTERLREQDRLKDAEEALRQAQKMEAVGQLTGGLAHDFNNLLAGISGAFEMIGVRLAQGRSADVEKYLNAGQGATRRAASLTHRLLAFSRRQTLSPKPMNVNRLMTEFVDLVQRTVGPSIAVETVAAGGLWQTMVDPNQLENALLNLCINARDAMPHGGKITMETGNRWLDMRAAKEHGLEPGQYVTISVSDTGIGIDKETLPRVFDPFFTTKPLGQGTGLGLSMVYGFARQSHGHVRLYSEVGKGTMVCIYLPRHIGEDAAEDDSQAAPAPAAPTGAGETVLVVDDEPTVRMLIVDALKDAGYHCLEAGDGPSALKTLEGTAQIDLLITDVGLPGLNGRQVADAARQLRSGLKVLFITGYAENAALNHGHIAHGMEVMTKPFSVDDLATRVERMLKES